MSLLTHTLAEAAAILRGETAASGRVNGFRINNEAVTRWTGNEAAPGHEAVNSDEAWESVVRAWWGMGATWGLCVSGEQGDIAWSLVHSGFLPAALDAIPAHLTGARLQPGVPFSQITARLRALPFQASMAGHPSLGDSARIEHAVRSMAGRDFLFVLLAHVVSRPEIEAELQRLAQEEQFLRDEHLARPGLEQDNHSAAASYLALIEAASERAKTALQEGAWQVRVLLAANREEDFRQAQSLIHSAYSCDGGKPEPLRWQETSDPRSLTFLRTAELAALSRPPRRELPGFTIETQFVNAGTPAPTATAIFATTSLKSDGPTIAIGQIVDDGGIPRAWFELSIADLCRHLLIAGMTGSGKTVSCEHILLELWREHRIPWLVIEPGMKTSYRRLANSEIGPDLDLWAVGVPRTRRLPLNPMAAPVGVSLAEHTSALFAVISSAFELIAPMPEVLATAIEETYRRHGWNLGGYVPEGPSPTLRDLIEEIDRSTRILGYGAEITGNIRAGLLVRLQRLANGPLAPEFNSTNGIDAASLVKRPTVIELSALPDASSQAFVMGMIALQLRHHWRMAGQSDTLRHATVIEEAHRLLRSMPETAANSARNRATEDLANMLAELRGFGAGLIVVDQTPSALVPAVIANTGTKILHRLDHPTDRDLSGRAAGLPATYVDLLGALRPGDAILRSDRRPRPFRLRMPNPSLTYGDQPVPSLPTIDGPASPKEECSVCGQSHCQSAFEGSNPGKLKHRIAKFATEIQASDRNGADSAWEWAGHQLLHEGSEDAPALERLCFLVAMAESAKLSAKTIGRIREAFASKIQPPATP